MGLPKPLNELLEIARRGGTVTTSDLHQILGEVARLQEIDREQLKVKARAWKERLGRLDMMAAEMVGVPGAEALLYKAKAVNLAISKLDGALEQARVSGIFEDPADADADALLARARSPVFDPIKIDTLDCRLGLTTNLLLIHRNLGDRDKLPKPLAELIARRDDWHLHLVGSDLRQILGEVERLSGQVRDRLVKTIAGWKKRLGRLDMMAAEMLGTPGAEALLAKAKAANNAINDLDDALDLAVAGHVIEPVEEGEKSVQEINMMRCRSKAEWSTSGEWELYQIQTGIAAPVRLGAVTPNEDTWGWCRIASTILCWSGNGGGAEDTLEKAKAKVLEGWSAAEEEVEEKVEEKHPKGQWFTRGNRKLYQVPTGKDTGDEWLGTIVPNGAKWDWCRRNSRVHDWDGERGGTEDTLEKAKAKILEGWL